MHKTSSRLSIYKYFENNGLSMHQRKYSNRKCQILHYQSNSRRVGSLLERVFIHLFIFFNRIAYTILHYLTLYKRGFGTVELIEEGRSNQLFALKKVKCDNKNELEKASIENRYYKLLNNNINISVFKFKSFFFGLISNLQWSQRYFFI